MTEKKNTQYDKKKSKQNQYGTFFEKKKKK